MKFLNNIFSLLAAIAKYIFFPESIQYNYEIIPFEKIQKMKKQSLATEYIRSRRRIDEYIDLTAKAIWLRQKILIFFHLLAICLSILSYTQNWRIHMKIGDLFVFVPPQLYSIYANIRILLIKRRPIIEERVSIEKIADLKAKLIQSLKYEWNYMDNQNKTIAGAQAWLKTLFVMIVFAFIQNALFLEIKHISLLSLIDKIEKQFCEKVSIASIGLTFDVCDYFSLITLPAIFLVHISHELAILLSGLQSSGVFFSNQNLKPNFISSVYLDNLSLSVLNPNQNETV
jgi:hypothetical protein